MNCSVCNENNWKAEYEKDVDVLGDVETIFLTCHGCGNIWTAQIET
jgi:DNA-directed RNA polymerase subunit M/transcription elongation factor TFIIS